MDAAIVAILIYLACANVVAFALYGIDKSRARRGEWRVSERALLLSAFLGGGVGAACGMLAFRHKVRKPCFAVGVPLACVLTLAIGGCAWYVGDYYHADERALAAAGESIGSGGDPDDVEVRLLGSRAIAFVPAGARVGFVFYPGAKVQPEAYAPLMRACADEGILCVLLKPALNLAIVDVGAAEGIADAFPQVERWAIGGHSMGGVAAASYLSEHRDVFEGVVFLASYPSADLSAFDGWSLSVVGSDDGVLNRDRYAEAQAELPSDAVEVLIEGGNHAGFGDYGVQAGDGEAHIAPADQQAQTAQAIAQRFVR